jgi:hypothetical protein
MPLASDECNTLSNLTLDAGTASLQAQRALTQLLPLMRLRT